MDIVYRVGADGYDGALLAERDDLAEVSQLRRICNENTEGDCNAELEQ